MEKTVHRDYRLTGKESQLAVEKGLAEATWYTSPVPRDKMKELLVRKNGPAIRDTIIWILLIFSSGYLFYLNWGSWLALLPYIVYSTLVGSTSDSRWHESSHGTAFKTDWMNNVLYEIASFMVFRQSVVWRWSHTRHHSDTIIRGRDAEIAVKRPPNLFLVFLGYFGVLDVISESKKTIKHVFNIIDTESATFIPMNEYGKVFIRAKIYFLIYAIVISVSIYHQTILPLMFIGLPTILGRWLMPLYGYTQHAGLAENVLDHRLNCRTVYMDVVNRFLYWNMNYHVEHHMFPLVPYHALPKLHLLVKKDMPKPYSGIINAYKEIIPTVIRQAKDPAYFVKRELPKKSKSFDASRSVILTGNEDSIDLDGWIQVCGVDKLGKGDVVRFDVNENTYAVYRTIENRYYATDGICTHSNAHLADGLVIDDIIECPKHNGRFDIKDGSPKRPPACIGLKTHQVKVENDFLYLNTSRKKDIAELQIETLKEFKVVSNDNVATFIKELILEPMSTDFEFKPGDYIQLSIPSFETTLSDVQIQEPYKLLWRENGIFNLMAKNTIKTKRNYSIASNPTTDRQLRFNIRIALPPMGKNYYAGVGSSYVFGLKPGDVVTATGPFGDFHIKESDKEMVYIGGGAGMAPIRSHLSYLLDSVQSKRRISYWYGARSLKELYYETYFEQLAKKNNNFSFKVALSEPEANDTWLSFTGFIHDVVEKEFLKKQSDLNRLEFYLCGPPVMIEAVLKMLDTNGVDTELIAFDEF
jgi:Na+-transporting NADH:ubiquinone oxidoreductase subunit F